MPHPQIAPRTCSIENCGGRHEAKGLCARHYKAVWRKENPEKVRATLDKYRKNNPETIQDRNARYRKANLEKVRASKTKYRENNLEVVRAGDRRWRTQNKAYLATYKRNKKRTDIQTHLSSALRSRLYCAIKDGYKAGSSVKDLGCSLEDLKRYLEAQFVDGMNWANWSRDGWHIDHILPLASFDLTDRDQFLRAAHFTNLRPLWAKDNLKRQKSRRVAITQEALQID